MALEPIKINSKVVDALRENKKKTGTPIGTFVEQLVIEKLNIASLENRNRAFIKNTVYKFGNEKRLCKIVDNEIAMLCKFTPHKKDSGYQVQFSDIAVYSSDPNIDTSDKKIIGRVDGINFIPTKIK